LNDQTLHLQTVDLIGNIHYFWQNWKQASVFTGLTLKLYIDSPSFEYEDSYDNELRVRTTLTTTQTKFEDLDALINIHFNDAIWSRELKYSK